MCRYGNPDATPTVRVLPSSQDCRKLIVQGGKGGVVNSGIKHSVITPFHFVYNYTQILSSYTIVSCGSEWQWLIWSSCLYSLICILAGTHIL